MQLVDRTFSLKFFEKSMCGSHCSQAAFHSLVCSVSFQFKCGNFNFVFYQHDIFCEVIIDS